MTKKFLALLTFVFGALVAVSTPAQAELVRFSFTADQDFSDDSASAPAGSYYAQAAALSTVTGVLQYDTDNLTPQGTSPVFQAYAGPIDILLDQFSTANPDLPINLSSVVDRLPGDGGDQFAGNYDGPYDDGVGFYDTLSFQFFDSTGTAFTSQSLPLDMNLSDFTSAHIFITTLFFDGDNANTISYARFAITNLTNMSEVPLPAAALLFLSGFAGLFASRRKS